MNRPSLCSVVVPCYNEEINVEPFYNALTSVIDGLGFGTEIIFVDDGSSDHTPDIIRALVQKDERVKLLQFSRNFGSHAALSAGLHWATGDFAVMISVDLQDPPDLIPNLIEKWQEGFHVVWAVRSDRDDPIISKMLASAFYNLFRRIALPDYPPSGMDFGLLDRRVLDAFKKCHELNHLVTGMIVWLGFRQTQVPYNRKGRHAGASKWSLANRIKKAVDGIVSFSYLPIRVTSYIGFTVCLTSFLYGLFIIIRRLFFGLGETGWPSVMVVVLFLGGIQLITLGILGEYFWRGMEQAKGRPMYVIMEQLGFDKEYSK